MKRLTRLKTLAAACAVLAAPEAPAVYLNPDGLGQALIFPYYTTRPADGNAFNTYVSIVNHTADTKAIRVRFREGRNGREVAGFNLFLAPFDSWAGAVVPPPVSNLPARLVSADRSCVAPAFTADGGASVPYLDFRNTLYANANADGLGDGLDRTREGYIEAIEMATIPAGVFADAVRPSDTGPPADCAVAGAPAIVVAAPTGGISGTLTLINVQSGLDFTANAEALADLSTLPFYRPPSDPYPDFTSAEVEPVSHFVTGGKSHRVFWTNRAYAVSAVLTRPRLENEIILDTLTRSGTDWVVTFPTKRLLPTGVGDPGPFAPSLDSDRRSVPFQLSFRSREGVASNLVGACVGLCPPGTQVAQLRLPHTATVVGFRTGAAPAGMPELTQVLGSSNSWMVTIPTTAQNGSAALTFDGLFTTPRLGMIPSQTLRLTDGLGAAENINVEGMPAVGFAVRTFRNGAVTCVTGTCQGNYGGLFPHKSRITLAP